MQDWLTQAYRVLDPEKTIVRRNGDWLSPLALKDVVEIASNFTVAQFLEHETFRNRMADAKPLYIHEFIYALMQAYDAFTMDTDVQVGGSDQLFNIMAGRQLQRAKGVRPLVAVCTPLLIGTDGALKMSKSVGNSILIDDTPSDMYGKLMSIPDSLITNYYTLLTDVPSEQLVAIEQGISDGSLHPMEAKKRLARTIVAMLHGDEAADGAQGEFERVFQQRQQPVETQDLPVDLGPDGLATVDVVDLLVGAGAATSKSEARRLLSQGGVTLEGRAVVGPRIDIAEGLVLRVGRHRFYKVVKA
jgi:tyrosyl-tRNA synthetase